MRLRKRQMTSFVYKAKQTPEKVLNGTIEAEDRTQAIQQLRSMGYGVLSLEEAKEGLSLGMGISWDSLRRIKVADLAMFWRQLASLLEAGLPLVRALATVEEQSENPKLARVVAGVRSAVEGAASFSQALSRYPKVFTPLYVNLAATAEATGTLAQVADQLAGRVEKEQELRGKVTSALIYPTFLCIVGAVVVSVLVTFVIPKFAVLFEGLGQDLPLPTKVLLGVNTFAHRFWWLVGVVLLGTLILVYHFTRKGPGRLALDSLKLHLPIVGRVIRKIEMAKFAHTFSTLCANGVHILPALKITARTVTNQVIAGEVTRARERIAQGSRVEAALREGRHFPPALVNMVAVGEDSASLDKMLERVAVVYERDSDRAVRSMTTLLESVLILLLGGAVGLIVAAILLPIFRASAIVG